MPKNFYPDLTIEQLLPIRERIREARNGGSLTSVGIEPRISNQFAAVPPKELNKRLEEVEWSLHLIAKCAFEQNGDKTLLEKYPDPYRAKIMRVKVIHGPGHGMIGGGFGNF